MNRSEAFNTFTEQLLAFIQCGHGRFDDLARVLFQLQFEHNPVYRRLCVARSLTPAAISDWREIPALPTAAFKEFEVTSLAAEERTTFFLSSGTTEQQRSRHFHSPESLTIYEASLLPWFKEHLLPAAGTASGVMPGTSDGRISFLILTPPPQSALNSSLAHMFDTVRREFGNADSIFAGSTDAAGAWTLDLERALDIIRAALASERPLVLLGTAFNFVHLLDHLAAQQLHYQLPAGSRVLETGGYKGRAREIPKAELHTLMTKHLGIAETHIVTEYGMSELSSQAYDRVAGEVQGSTLSKRSPCLGPCVFHFPPWACVQVISPETGREVPEGESGLIRVFDLANVRSVMAIQTEDLGVRRGDGFELIGRASQAEARGCSLMSISP